MPLASKLVFRDDGIIDVTRFDSTPENPVIGYMCGGTISVFSDEDIKVHDCDKVLEAFHVKDIVLFNSNINSYDPEHLTEVALIIRTVSNAGNE